MKSAPENSLIEGQRPILATSSQATAPCQQNDVAELTKLHSEVLEGARISLRKAVLIGEILIRLKKQSEHGGWQKFVDENLPFKCRTASNYMALYREREELLKPETVTDLGLTDAYRRLRNTGESPAINAPGLPGNTPDAADHQDQEESKEPDAENEQRTPKLAKQQLVTNIGWALLRDLEKLTCEQLAVFEKDLNAFKSEWLTRLSPDAKHSKSKN